MLSFSCVPMSVCIFVTPGDILCTTTTWTDCVYTCTVVDVSFVIVKAFYPLLLTVTCKFGVHFQPIKKITVIGCRTLLGRLYLFTSYALQCLIAFRNLLSYLGVIFILFDQIYKRYVVLLIFRHFVQGNI